MKNILKGIAYVALMFLLLTLLNIIVDDEIDWSKNIIISVFSYLAYLFLNGHLILIRLKNNDYICIISNVNHSYQWVVFFYFIPTIQSEFKAL